MHKHPPIMSDGTEKVIRRLTGTLTSTRRNKEVADALLLLDKELSKRNFVAITSHLHSPTFPFAVGP